MALIILPKQPAMDRETVLKAIEIGFNYARYAKDNGYDIIGNGEVGMGNTTTAAACVMAAPRCYPIPKLRSAWDCRTDRRGFCTKKTGHCRRFEKSSARPERCGGYSQQGRRVNVSDDGTVYRRGLL